MKLNVQITLDQETLFRLWHLERHNQTEDPTPSAAVELLLQRIAGNGSHYPINGEALVRFCELVTQHDQRTTPGPSELSANPIRKPLEQFVQMLKDHPPQLRPLSEDQAEDRTANVPPATTADPQAMQLNPPRPHAKPPTLITLPPRPTGEI